MSHYTNLSLSRKIASLGVECESERIWLDPEAKCPQAINRYLYKAHLVYNGMSENNIKKIFKDSIPQYSLHELVPVLQAIGAVKGWDIPKVKFDFFGRAKGVVEIKPKYMWRYHFLEIARLYLNSEEKAFSYLEELLN